MMRLSCVWIAVCTILNTGGDVHASVVQPESIQEAAISNSVFEELPRQNYETQIGGIITVSINVTLVASNYKCLIITPDGEQHTITELEFNLSGIDKIRESGVDCGVRFHISKDMAGDWTLISEAEMFNAPYIRSLPFTITVEGIYKEDDNHGGTFEEVDEAEIDDNNIVWLTDINHFTRIGMNIDISLSKIDHEEDCYIRTPDGNSTKAGESEISGVTVQMKSNFVSCRITVGPMEAHLLGSWALCGKYTEAEEEHERCQLVNINWNNNNNPITLWDSTIRPRFDHAVNFNGTLTPTVSGLGSLITCHIVTPQGEDLVITSDSRYPGLVRDAINVNSICSIVIGPIHDELLGEWILYGMFRSSFGLNEVRFPITLSLYDEDYPYNQAYNVSVVATVNRVVNLGNNITATVTGTGIINECQYRVPSGIIFDYNSPDQYQGVSFVDDENLCSISIGPITEAMLGEWQMIGKFRNGNLFDERQHTFHIKQEDPENPLEDENRTITNLPSQHIDTVMHSTIPIIVNRDNLIAGESCHVRTPAGLQYKIMDGFNLPGVEIISGSNIECGINITVLSEDMIGEWTLISRAVNVMLSDSIERRLAFTISVEELVDAFPQEITISEGNDLYIRLMNPTDLYESCRLIGPNGDVNSLHEIDEMYSKSCGFIIKNVSQNATGKWEIIYGNGIVYSAVISVNIIARSDSQVMDLILIENSQINKEMGPEETVYCKLEDPQGFPVFEGFGKCRFVLEKISMDHHGRWKMYIGLPGRIVVEELSFWVTVNVAASRPVVATNVFRERPTVVLSCSVPSDIKVQACKFRDPSGTILMATHGVGEDRFVFYGSQTSNETDAQTHECGLRITSPTIQDLGLWRCAIDTDADTYYGFPQVLCPWLLQDPEVAASVVTDPILTVHRAVVSGVEGEDITMSCSVQSAIRYCYFRAQNGTVFSVTPETSSPYAEYVGSGFDAGECGVRFSNLLHSDSGRWSCHVGLLDKSEGELRDRFDVTIEEAITVRHYWNENNWLVVKGEVQTDHSLEYCRFVRIDGFGFTTDKIPAGYTSLSSLDSGYCLLHIAEPTILNLHPWTVVAKVRGLDGEISRATTENLLWFGNEITGKYMSIYIWIAILLISLSVLLLGVSLGPKKNRDWTYARASEFRSSIRNSLRKSKLSNQV